MYVYSIQTPNQRYGIKIISDINHDLTKITTYESDDNKSLGKIINEGDPENYILKNVSNEGDPENYILNNDTGFFNSANYHPTFYEKFKEYSIRNLFTYYGVGKNYNIKDWIMTSYSMEIWPNSVYSTGPDIIKSIEWDNRTKEWKESINQISPSFAVQDQRMLNTSEIKNASNFFKNGTVLNKGYVSLGMDLGSINYPSSYKLMFSAAEKFEASKNKICTISEASDLVVAPPPKILLYTEPEIVRLQPSQTEDIKVIVNSSTDLNSLVSFTVQNKTGLKLHFNPPQISLSPHGISSSDLEVTALSSNTTSEPLHITGLVTFPEILVSNSSSSAITNSNETSITVNTSPFVTVVPPKPWLDQMEDISGKVTLSLQNITGILTTVGGIAASIVAFITVLNRSKKNQKQAGAPF